VDKLPNGHYALQVHIADVSHYVTPGSAIDVRSALRGTSVYFPGPRRAHAAVRAFDQHLFAGSAGGPAGAVGAHRVRSAGRAGLQFEFCRGVIRSAERMTYTNVHLLLEGDPALRERYAPLVERFELMRELAPKS
jgi:ribonuclease R